MRHKPAVVQRSGQMSGDNPLSTTTNYYKKTGTASRGNTTGGEMFSGSPIRKQ